MICSNTQTIVLSKTTPTTQASWAPQKSEGAWTKVAWKRKRENMTKNRPGKDTTTNMPSVKVASIVIPSRHVTLVTSKAIWSERVGGGSRHAHFLQIQESE